MNHRIAVLQWPSFECILQAGQRHARPSSAESGFQALACLFLEDLNLLKDREMPGVHVQSFRVYSRGRRDQFQTRGCLSATHKNRYVPDVWSVLGDSL